MSPSFAKRLQEQGKESIKYDRWTLAPKLKVDWKVVEGARDQVVEILKVHVPELVKETVNHMSLNSYLNKQGAALDAESPVWWRQLRPILEVHESLTLSMRKR